MFGKFGLRTAVVALTAIGMVGCAGAPKKDVVDTLAASGNHNTLVQAVKAAGLESALRDKGPYTVFAPTDQAFAALPKEAVADLMKPENKAQLVNVLQHHVVAGNMPTYTLYPLVPPGNATNTALFNKNKQVKTLAGNDANVSQWEGTSDGLWVDNIALVTKPNVAASNGTVHVVDRVLLVKK